MRQDEDDFDGFDLEEHVRARLGREDVRKMLDACGTHPENFICIGIDGALQDLSPPGALPHHQQARGAPLRIRASYWPDEMAEEGFDGVAGSGATILSNFWSLKPNTLACCVMAYSTWSRDRTSWKPFAIDRMRSSVGSGRIEPPKLRGSDGY